jgi:uncharacterized membrane protein
MNTRLSSAPAALLVGILGTAGVAHFVVPKQFDAIVPRWMPGSPRTTTYASGVLELATAALVKNVGTRRLGGMAALATFVGVYPANIQAALDGGYKSFKPPFDSAVVAWARLPLQFPLFWLARRVIRNATRR